MTERKKEGGKERGREGEGGREIGREGGKGGCVRERGEGWRVREGKREEKRGGVWVSGEGG